MSHTPHELAEEFPNDIDRLAQLRQDDAHLARLMDLYHAVNRQVHRGESNVEPVSDEHMTALRRERMALKDSIAAILRESAA